ncbi:MAG: hypothetical protein J5589_03930 [Firmicutes bacterium]|nr:hypothetical protein [Bacillota bacterium]
MKPGGSFSKLFLGSYYFTIALRERQPRGLTDGEPFRAQTVLPAVKDDWAADPMLVDDGDRTWLFYEAVKGTKGRIEVAEVSKGCRLSRPQVILEDACHYSYPFVFQADGTWYMIPESSAAKEVRLYRALSFPFRWELQTVLLHERAVDTTVFFHEGQYWLLTFLLEGGSERVFPRAYTVVDWCDPVLREVPWPEYDPLRVRGAGPVFRSDGVLLRPAQISQPQRYGDGLVFYRPRFSDRYAEGPAFEITERDLRIRGVFADGLHTYSCCSRYEAIDVRCRAADPFKILKRLLRR